MQNDVRKNFILNMIRVIIMIIILTIILSLYRVRADKNKKVHLNSSVNNSVKLTREISSWYTGLDIITGKTLNDDANFIIKVNIAYPMGETGIQSEIISKRIPIMDIILEWFNSQEFRYLINNENKEDIKNILEVKIKEIMSDKSYIKGVAFTQYQITDLRSS